MTAQGVGVGVGWWGAEAEAVTAVDPRNARMQMPFCGNSSDSLLLSFVGGVLWLDGLVFDLRPLPMDQPTDCCCAFSFNPRLLDTGIASAWLGLAWLVAL